MTECSWCNHPIADEAAACSFCGLARGHSLRVRIQPARNHAVGRRRSASLMSFPARALYVLFGSVLAALVVHHHNSVFLALNGDVLGKIAAATGSNFLIAMVFVLIPRTSGLILALGVLAIRTYLQFSGLSLFALI